MVAVFVLGGLATLYLMAMFLSGICFRMRRRWPPTAISRGQAAEIWGMSVLAFGCAYLAPSLGTASSPLPEALRHWGGGALLGIGNLIAGLAVVDLGLAQTTGAMGPLCRHRCYGWSRHPQYLGHGLSLLGWALWCGTLLALPLVLGVIAAMALAICAEDRWLAAQHGEAFARYRARVPCLVGL